MEGVLPADGERWQGASMERGTLLPNVARTQPIDCSPGTPAGGDVAAATSSGSPNATRMVLKSAPPSGSPNATRMGLRSARQELSLEGEPTPQRLTSSPARLYKMHEDLRNKLMAAIKNDNPIEIECLVRRGASLQAHYLSHRRPARPGTALDATSKGPASGLVNPVEWAVLHYHFRAAKQLLELADGKIVFSRDENRSSLVKHELARETSQAVFVAAARGELELLRMLLDRGAHVGQANLQGESALRHAVRREKLEVVRLLLQYGAWEAEGHKSAVLDWAQRLRVDCVLKVAGVLAEHGGGEPLHGRPPPWEELRGELGGTPHDGDRAFKLDRHVENMDDPDRFKSTGRGLVNPTLPIPQDAVQTWTETRVERSTLQADFALAIQKGNVEKVKVLVLKGVPFDTVFDLGYGDIGNCVDWACVSEQPRLALTLLELAAKAGQADDLCVHASAALFWSVLHGYLDLLRELLRRGANPGRRVAMQAHGAYSGSLLTLAVSSWRAGEARELLRHGAWDLEPEPQQRHILGLARNRGGAVVHAFEDAGIRVDMSSRGRPLPHVQPPSLTGGIFPRIPQEAAASSVAVCQ